MIPIQKHTLQGARPSECPHSSPRSRRVRCPSGEAPDPSKTPLQFAKKTVCSGEVRDSAGLLGYNIFYSPTGGTPPAPTFFPRPTIESMGKTGGRTCPVPHTRRFALVRVACTGSSIRGLDDLPVVVVVVGVEVSGAAPAGADICVAGQMRRRWRDVRQSEWRSVHIPAHRRRCCRRRSGYGAEPAVSASPAAGDCCWSTAGGGTLIRQHSHRRRRTRCGFGCRCPQQAAEPHSVAPQQAPHLQFIADRLSR